MGVAQPPLQPGLGSCACPLWRHLNDEQSWARVAAECGYADQAHLTREIRCFTGTTPGALITA